MAETRIDIVMIIVKALFIILFFLSDVGKYLIMLLPIPRLLKLEIKVITEISVVPIPTHSGVNVRAFMTQKKKPRTDITAVPRIK